MRRATCGQPGSRAAGLGDEGEDGRDKFFALPCAIAVGLRRAPPRRITTKTTTTIGGAAAAEAIVVATTTIITHVLCSGMCACQAAARFAHAHAQVKIVGFCSRPMLTTPTPTPTGSDNNNNNYSRAVEKRGKTAGSTRRRRGAAPHIRMYPHQTVPGTLQPPLRATIFSSRRHPAAFFFPLLHPGRLVAQASRRAYASRCVWVLPNAVPVTSIEYRVGWKKETNGTGKASEEVVSRGWARWRRPESAGWNWSHRVSFFL